MAENAFFPADILIPASADMTKWSVVACDQFSSDRDYWERVKRFVGDAPSTLKLIVPEAYLSDGDTEERAAGIAREMDSYLDSGVFRTLRSSYVYVERTVESGEVRRGVVGVLDLEKYDYAPGSRTAIRASEGTIVSRLPARIKVRRGAKLELPHIMALINDRDCTVIEPLERADLPLLYDFDLMEGGGHICGYQVTGEAAAEVTAALAALAASSDVQVIMGDGNHSLAAAKGYWDEIKGNIPADERETHPARFALVELNNVYDPAIAFEAIHRAVFGVDADTFAAAFELSLASAGGAWPVRCRTAEKDVAITVDADTIGGLIGKVQDFIDDYLAKNGGEVDYIHGEAEVLALGRREGAAGIVLPAMGKGDFFATVESGGAFPRKSFSIGHAREKRYYLECRKITK
ncbi:MAG: DUF1015 domain-containing protein [Oscillospiraceae bacterium]|nr:DUF1015 domain-containing protein [Oscillospiraceae bacterium]